MSYKTLYRTYRPKNFSEVVGQEHITRTFKNALKKDKISHAYLFTGPRGTGKTSVAKIIAKAVNCEKAPTDEPCNTCESCQSINTGFDSDVFEIDAASNNGVDEIREIRDKVKYAPTFGRFKVYIIDEVHMLSTGAFNALLKTLEEPPSHVIFILATTEPHKIPATIISRCQRFDFKSIAIKEIISRMKYVISVENIKIEEKAIYTIAKNAQGGMRDALSLLDQAISYSDEEVKESDVHEITGTVSEDHLSVIVSNMIDYNAKEVISLIDDLIAMGKEPLRLMDNIIFYFRDLFMLVKISEIDKQLITNHSEKTKELAKKIPGTKIYQLISILNQAQYEMRKTNQPRVFIELALFEMINLLNKESTEVHHKEDILAKEEQSKKQETVELDHKADEDSQENIEEEIIIEKKPMVETEEKYIDVTKIENVLNNGDKETKLQLVMQWQSLKGTDIEYTYIEQLLIDGTVEAVSFDKKIILSYEHDSFCAKLYEQEVYKKAIALLKRVFHVDYVIIALPQRIWIEKRDEFIEQFKKKIKQPKLSPITEPILVKKNTNRYEFEPEFVKSMVDLFGEDLVNIK